MLSGRRRENQASSASHEAFGLDVVPDPDRISISAFVGGFLVEFEVKCSGMTKDLKTMDFKR